VALALSLLLTALGACGGDGPTGTARPGDDTGLGGGDGLAARVVGTWRNVVIVELPGDLQTWTTVWRFDAVGTCLRTVEIESLAEGFPRVTERACTYLPGDFEITITFEGSGPLVFDYSFAAFSADRLILDGFEYERLA
jgi:hypothetical protein